MISGGLAGSNTKPDDQTTFWSVFSSLFSSIRLQNLILKQMAQDKFFSYASRKMGVFGIVIQTIMGIAKISNNDKLTDDQKLYSYIVSGASALLSGIALFLPLGIALGPVGAILFTFVYLTTILFVINFIKELALESIRDAGA